MGANAAWYENMSKDWPAIWQMEWKALCPIAADADITIFYGTYSLCACQGICLGYWTQIPARLVYRVIMSAALWGWWPAVKMTINHMQRVLSGHDSLAITEVWPRITCKMSTGQRLRVREGMDGLVVSGWSYHRVKCQDSCRKYLQCTLWWPPGGCFESVSK